MVQRAGVGLLAGRSCWEVLRVTGARALRLHRSLSHSVGQLLSWVSLAHDLRHFRRLLLDVPTILEVLHRLDKAALLEMLDGARKSPLEIPPEPFRNLRLAGPLKRLHDP